MADQKDEKPPISPENLLLPYERKEPGRDVEKDLFDLLGSDPDFQDDEDADDADELESDDEEEEESDEPESDDDEEEDEDLGDGDSEEDEDDEDSDEEDEDQEDDEELHEVKVQGENLKVNLEELKAGYSRTEDYTRKSQANATEQATAMAEIGGVRETYDAHLAQLQEVMKQMVPAEPDWGKLREENPGEYAAAKQDYNDKLTALDKVTEERSRVQAETDKETLAARSVYLQGEFDKMVEAIPEWKNEAVRATEIGELRDFAQESYGYSDEDLNSVVDHRLLLLLRDAKQTQEKTKKGKKEIRKKSKGARKMKPGSSHSPRRKATRQKGEATQHAREKLAQSGSVHDAAAAIHAMLDDEE